MGDSEREAAILARCEAATKGPWATDPDDGLEDYRVVRDTPEWRASQGVVAEVVIERFGFGQDDNETNDAEFCAHAREDVPWLLAQLTAARARAERAEGALGEMAGRVPTKVERSRGWVGGWVVHFPGQSVSIHRLEIDLAQRALAARGE